MFRELVALGIFDGKLDYRVKINRPEMIFDFKIEVRPMSRTLAITHLGPFSQSSGPIAMLGPGGLDASPNYSERLIDEVLEDVKQQLITANPERQVVLLVTPQAATVDGRDGHGGDWFSAGVSSGHLTAPLDLLVRRGVFRAKLPDILIGTVVVRVDKEDRQNPVLKIGFWDIRDGRPDICWVLNYTLEGRKLEVLPGKMAVTAFTSLISQTLTKYNEILNGFVVNADNGLLE